MASVACTLPVLGLCIHTSGSPSVSGTAGCFSLEFRASAVFDRCDARRKQHQQRRRRRLPLRAPCCMSVDVDSEQDNVNSQLKSPQERDEGIPALNPRRGLEERFAVLNTGRHECRSCGHIYDETKGDMLYPVAAGTAFQSLPDDWRCPTCGAAKTYFSSKSIEVAGFAQNQQFGLGGNSLTSGQKSILIYGTLLFFFALFLSGYFLQ
jgi:rubredoxin